MRASSLVALLVTSGAFAQAPDVTIKGDLSLGFVSGKESPVGFRLITPLARFSTISLSTLTADGLTIKASQRLASISGDADNELFDEYYVEDAGSWRVGKQYLPFGGQFLLRESVLAARLDTSLIFEGLPLSIAFVDGGAGRQYGFVGRLGASGLGFSIASGAHWGVNGTAFAPAREFGSGLGRGSGFSRVLGFDWNRRFGKVTVRYESLSLIDPEIGGPDSQLDDLGVTYDLGNRHLIGLGWTKGFQTDGRILRVTGSYNARKGFSGEAMFRTLDGRFLDVSMMLRVRF